MSAGVATAPPLLAEVQATFEALPSPVPHRFCRSLSVSASLTASLPVATDKAEMKSIYAKYHEIVTG